MKLESPFTVLAFQWLVFDFLYLPTLNFLRQIRTIAIIAEGIPEAKTRQLNKKAQEAGVTIIGPATVSSLQVLILHFDPVNGLFRMLH